MSGVLSALLALSPEGIGNNPTWHREAVGRIEVERPSRRASPICPGRSPVDRVRDAGRWQGNLVSMEATALERVELSLFDRASYIQEILEETGSTQGDLAAGCARGGLHGRRDRLDQDAERLRRESLLCRLAQRRLLKLAGVAAVGMILGTAGVFRWQRPRRSDRSARIWSARGRPHVGSRSLLKKAVRSTRRGNPP